MNIHAVAAFIWADKTHPEIWEFEPETIMELLQIDKKTLEKIQVCYLIFHNDSVFENHVAFEKAACVLNDREADFETYQELSASEVAWAIHCIRSIDDKSPFSDEVLDYISVILVHDGLFKVPESIDEKSPSLVPLEYYVSEKLPKQMLLTEAVESNQKKLLSYVQDYVQTNTKQLQQQIQEIMK